MFSRGIYFSKRRPQPRIFRARDPSIRPSFGLTLVARLGGLPCGIGALAAAAAVAAGGPRRAGAVAGLRGAHARRAAGAELRPESSAGRMIRGSEAFLIPNLNSPNPEMQS